MTHFDELTKRTAMKIIEETIKHINKQSLKVLGRILVPDDLAFQSEYELLHFIHKKWTYLYLHPKGRILSFNWLKTHFSSQQLKDAQIYLSGTHKVKGNAVVGNNATIYHFGEGRIYAAGKSTVIDFGNGNIYAGDDTTIHAHHSNSVFAKGHSLVTTHTTRPIVHAWQQAVVMADTHATITAHGYVHLVCRNGGHIVAKDHSFLEVSTNYIEGRVELYGKSIAMLYGTTEAFVANEATAKAHDECIVDVEDRGIVYAYNYAKVTASCEARVYASDSAKVSLSDSAICKPIP